LRQENKEKDRSFKENKENIDIFSFGSNEKNSSDEDEEEICITEQDLKLEFFKAEMKELELNGTNKQKESSKDQQSDHEGFVKKILNRSRNENTQVALNDLKRTNKTLCNQCGKYVDTDYRSIKTHMQQCSNQFKLCK